ncbi:MAG: flagellar biosynthetic protein FliO [Planctomycetota bacterium]|jgi:flagellar biogenesis protein FliO|nr:flagellar biosynthetic protein FliO [Planctomycetota bacterium]
MAFAATASAATGRFRRRGLGGWPAALLFAASAVFIPPAGAADSPAAPDSAQSPFERSIHENEAALRQMEQGEAAAKGWGLAEILGLAALLAAVGMMLWLARLMRGGPLAKKSGREMRLVDRLALERQSELLIVRIRGRDYWIARTPHSIVLLAELPEAAASAETPDRPREAPIRGKPGGPAGTDKNPPSPELPLQ